MLLTNLSFKPYILNGLPLAAANQLHIIEQQPQQQKPSTHLSPIPDNRHRDQRAGLRAGRQRHLPELGLLDADVVVDVQPPAAEVLAPVGVLVVQHQQRKAAVLVERRPGGRRHGGADNRGALITRRTGQTLDALQQRLTRLGRTGRCADAARRRRLLAEAQRQIGRRPGGRTASRRRQRLRRLLAASASAGGRCRRRHAGRPVRIGQRLLLQRTLRGARLRQLAGVDVLAFRG